MKTNAWIVETNLKVRISWSEYERLCQNIAEYIAAIPGLVWKVWVGSKARQEAGGVYLFQSRESMDAFLGSPFISQLESNPAFEDVQIKTFEVMEGLSAVTRFSAEGSLEVGS